LIRERFRPRVLEAKPASLLDESGNNLDPAKVWACMMSNEKPADTANARLPSAPSTWRFGTRSPKLKASRCSSFSPTGTATASRTAGLRLRAGGYYYPGKDLEALKQEMLKYVDRVTPW